MKHKFRLFTNGYNTYIELDGKTMGQGVTGVRFEHSENGDVKLELQIDIKDFEFMTDGTFGEVQKKFADLEEQVQSQQEEINQFPCQKDRPADILEKGNNISPLLQIKESFEAALRQQGQSPLH